MKATAVAPANIAFIKYWAKADPVLRVPQNNSISMNLSDLFSTCTVEFNEKFTKDQITFLGEEVVTENELKRISEALDRVRNLKNISPKARIVTKNNFPKATGIASSASGFAALTLAALAALDIKLEEKELSRLARLASGTACRSIPDGFVEWEKGTGPDDSYASQIFPPDYWQVCDVVAIVTDKMKKVGSTEGHTLAVTSPFYKARLEGIDEKLSEIKKFMKAKDFSKFGKLIEDEALNMHAICLTCAPPLLYWEPTTIAIMKKIIEWRENGELEAYFTIDAGPTVHAICEHKNAETLKSKLTKIEGVRQVIVNTPARGAYLVETHLF